MKVPSTIQFLHKLSKPSPPPPTPQPPPPKKENNGSSVILKALQQCINYHFIVIVKIVTATKHAKCHYHGNRREGILRCNITKYKCSNY